jgi:redox-sensitive bicupin YhaK (pirin superfamily)
MEHGWLKTFHTFSFGDYMDPAHMGFRSLRVMNEDWFAAGSGFGTHPHRDMEIVTHVLEGALTHRDSLGHEGVVAAGEWQRMTAGTGILHSEFNASETVPVHLYQIWITPDRSGLRPGYEQKRFRPVRGWRLVASGDGAEGSLTIYQDAQLHHGRLEAGESLTYDIPAGRYAWLQVLRGPVALFDRTFLPGDGIAFSEEPSVKLRAGETDAAEVLLFDLP